MIGLATGEYAASERFFPLAVAADPTKADYYYFWGDCLIREGKPGEAVERFRSALSRNEYETARTLYQAKMWLAEIQVNGDTRSGSGGKIDAGLAELNPPGATLIAGAARDARDGRYAEAAAKLRRATSRLEAPILRILLQDPAFTNDAWRPELSEFYKPAPAQNPESSPADTSR